MTDRIVYWLPEARDIHSQGPLSEQDAQGVRFEEELRVEMERYDFHNSITRAEDCAPGDKVELWLKKGGRQDEPVTITSIEATKQEGNSQILTDSTEYPSLGAGTLVKRVK